MLLSVVVDIHGGTTRRKLTNNTSYFVNNTTNVCLKVLAYATFWINHWIIPRHTKQPLDNW
jgi:hypothetical protein